MLGLEDWLDRAVDFAGKVGTGGGGPVGDGAGGGEEG